MKKIIVNIFYKLLSNINSKSLVFFIIGVVKSKIEKLQPKDSLKFLFELDNKLYKIQGLESTKYGNGKHSKYKHIGYQDFFKEHLSYNDKVLDIGCGNGLLSYYLAEIVNQGEVLGIEISEYNFNIAKRTYKLKNLHFVNADAITYETDKTFNVITMSNVFEHIENRVIFLKNINKVYNPTKLIIIVPLFSRHWSVPLKKEIGVDYRLDSTHVIEHTLAEFYSEIEEANMKVIKVDVIWGEIRAVIKPD
jgi:2-polyprenyl-3-methyl-5-hydroxy-6-metoxy-1,4-benzoquinol methylase